MPLRGIPVSSMTANRNRAVSTITPPTLLSSFPKKFTPIRYPVSPGRKRLDPKSCM